MAGAGVEETVFNESDISIESLDEVEVEKGDSSSISVDLHNVSICMQLKSWQLGKKQTFPEPS